MSEKGAPKGNAIESSRTTSAAWRRKGAPSLSFDGSHEIISSSTQRQPRRRSSPPLVGSCCRCSPARWLPPVLCPRQRRGRHRGESGCFFLLEFSSLSRALRSLPPLSDPENEKQLRNQNLLLTYSSKSPPSPPAPSRARRPAPRACVKKPRSSRRRTTWPTGSSRCSVRLGPRKQRGRPWAWEATGGTTTKRLLRSS